MKQKNFKEIYDVIYANVGNSMEAKRKSVLLKKILAYIIAILVWALILKNGINTAAPLLAVCFILTIALLSIITYKINKGYVRDYKEQIIEEIVKQSNPNLIYQYNEGISEREYAESNFDHGWDRYYTEDRIQGELGDGVTLRMAQVHTEERQESTDSDGHTTTTYVTTFFGLYGILTLRTATSADFMIRNNSKFFKFKKNRVEIESAEFEKYYDVFAGYTKSKNSEYRQSALEILTPETIEDFVKIRNMFKRAINVRVYRNKIYFRIDMGDIFEPPTFKSSVNFDMLRKYFLIIDVPRMLYEALIDNILVMYGNQDERNRRNIEKMNYTKEEAEAMLKKTEEENEASYFSHN